MKVPSSMINSAWLATENSTNRQMWTLRPMLIRPFRWEYQSSPGILRLSQLRKNKSSRRVIKCDPKQGLHAMKRNPIMPVVGSIFYSTKRGRVFASRRD